VRGDLPGDARIDRGRKLGIYAREGVSHLWLVDPLARTIETYELGSDRWALAGVHEGATPMRAAPFDALALDVARCWLEPAPA